MNYPWQTRTTLEPHMMVGWVDTFHISTQNVNVLLVGQCDLIYKKTSYAGTIFFLRERKRRLYVRRRGGTILPHGYFLQKAHVEQ